MANTYTKLYVQFVFSVYGRQNLILPAFEEELYKYITGTVQNLEHKMIAINGMPDHLHVFVGMRPNLSVSELANKIKSNSSRFINEKGFLKHRFQWQKGYGAFTYSAWDRSKIARYVENQKEHHRKKAFREEYLELLRMYEVDYDDRYLFDWVGE